MKISAFVLAFIGNIIDRAKDRAKEVLQSAKDALTIDEKEVSFEVAFGDLFTGTTESRVAASANDDTSAVVETSETATVEVAPTCTYTLYEVGKAKLCGRILADGETEVCANCERVQRVLALRRANEEAWRKANLKPTASVVAQPVLTITVEDMRLKLEQAFNDGTLSEQFPTAKVCGRAEGSYVQPIALVFNGRMQSFLVRDHKRFQEVEASKSLKASSGGGRPRIDPATAAARKAAATKQAEGGKKKEKGQKQTEGGKQHKRAANGR